VLPVPLFNYLLSRKTYKKYEYVLVTKCVFHLSLQCLFEIVFVPTSTYRGTLKMVAEMRAGRCANCKLFVTLSHFIQTGMYILINVSHIKFKKSISGLVLNYKTIVKTMSLLLKRNIGVLFESSEFLAQGTRIKTILVQDFKYLTLTRF
jgi:hypothetical protein